MLAMAENHDIKVIFATEISIREPSGVVNWLAGIAGRITGKTSYQDKINKHVFELNDWLRSYAESKQVGLLDFEAALADPDGQRRAIYATDDGSHVTSEAYRVLSSYTWEVMEPDLSVDRAN